MAWWYSVARFLWLLIKLLLNPSAVMNKITDDSFVKVGEPNMDFVIKIGVDENGR